MYDDNMRLCLGAEGMLCGELNEMYAFAAWFLSTYATKRRLSDVNVVAADQFLTRETVKQLGFVNAVFFLDRKHLLKDANMEKRFGRRAYHAMKHYVRDMVYADSVEVFNSSFT